MFHQIVVKGKAVMNHLRGRVNRPRHNAHGVWIGAHHHVAVAFVNHAIVGIIFWIFAGHRHAQNTLWQAHTAVFVEFCTR